MERWESPAGAKVVEPAEAERSQRPTVSPLLTVGLALWGSVAAVLPHLQTAPLEGCAALAVGGGLSAVVSLVVLWGRRGRRRVWLLLLMLGFACGLAVAGGSALELRIGAEMLQGQPYSWQVRLIEDAKPSLYGSTAKAEVVTEQRTRMRVRVYLPSGGDRLLHGASFSLQGSLMPFSAKSQEYAWTNGLAGTLDAKKIDAGQVSMGCIASLRARSIELLGRSDTAEGALLQALVCGYRGAFSENGASELFKRTGLAHLVAVSGAHLALVVAFLSLVLGALGASRRVVLVVTGLFLLGYIGFAGMPVSVLRAALMTATGMLAFLGRRRSSGLSALGLCLVLFVGMDGFCALSASFVLSAGSTLGILLFASWFVDLLPARGRRARRLVGEPLALTASSSLLTQPYSAALFSQLPLVSPLANVLAAPWFAVACVGGFVACALGLTVPGCAPFVLGLAELASRPLLLAVQWCAAVPFGCVAADVPVVPMVLLSVVLAAGLWAWWPAPPRTAAGWAKVALPLAAACALTVVLVAARTQGDAIVMLDVGQGDAILLRSQGRSVLVDTGNQDGLLREACGRNSVYALDAVAVSHHDDDHCGSLSALASVVQVERLLLAAPTFMCSCASCAELLREAEGPSVGLTPAGLEPGDEVRCGRFTLTALWPVMFTDDGGNGDSLVLLCSWDADGDGEGEWSALFTGDAEAEQLTALAPSLPPEGIDVLKVGHHGSKASLDAETAQRLHPSIALISVGEGNRYGHPSQECLDVLADQGTRVFRTDLMGDVTVAFSADALTVLPQRAPAADGVQ